MDYHPLFSRAPGRTSKGDLHDSSGQRPEKMTAGSAANYYFLFFWCHLNYLQEKEEKKARNT